MLLSIFEMNKIKSVQFVTHTSFYVRIDTNSKLVCVDCLADIFRAGRGLHTKTKRERMLGKRQKE